MPRQDKLVEFAAWVKQHLTGDEKGEARLYLDRLFQDFGLSSLSASFGEGQGEVSSWSPYSAPLNSLEELFAGIEKKG